MSSPGRRAAPLLALFALAAALAAPSLANGFVYDDVLVIQENPLVHGLARSGELWHSSYWPAGLLYRPLTLQLFALEWTLGGGSPLVFHLVSVLLIGALTLLVYRLAGRCLSSLTSPTSPTALSVSSALSALFFAVHPVHVEAVANAVGQAELLATLFALLAVERYLAWRSEGSLTPARRGALALLTLLGILAKETGYAIPLLLGAAELTVGRRTGQPSRGLRDTWLLQAAALGVALLLRAAVLGSVAGETPATVFRGFSTGERALAMLAVVPEWARLLLWPARLQAEYGPPGVPLTPALGGAHVAGLAVLLAGLALLVWSWRRIPVVAFALLWAAIALGPVSNLLVPSGLVLGERTLLLPSVGVALLLGVAAGAFAARLRERSAALRVTAAAAGVLLLALAAARSLSAAPRWRSQEIFFQSLEREAPRTYRAQLVVSRYYYGARRFGDAERAARRALALYDRDPQVHEQLGQVLRVQGRCGEAVPVLATGLALAPDGTTLRSRLIECLLATGDSSRARQVAADAVRLGQTEFTATVQRLTPKP